MNTDTLAPSQIELRRVTTTLPSTPYPRSDFHSKRLLLRSLEADDLQRFFDVHASPAVAFWSATGEPQTDFNEAKEDLERRIKNQYDRSCEFAMCLRSTGEFIGFGGVIPREGLFGWPNIGYKIFEEHWGKGYATEFLQAFLGIWWSMPRSEYSILVDETMMLPHEGEGTVQERVIAFTNQANVASQKVLLKNGSKLVKLWRTEDIRDTSKNIDLPCYEILSPLQTSDTNLGGTIDEKIK